MDNEKFLDVVSGKHRNLRNINDLIIAEWENGKYGRIQSLDKDKNCLYFIEYPIKAIQEPQIVAAGIIAFRFISSYDSINDIFDEYYNLMLERYKKRHALDADSWNKDMEVSFLQEHKESEKERIRLSENLFPFIDNDEISEIKSIAENYFVFLNTKNVSTHCTMNEEKNRKSVLKMISPSELRVYFEGWRNGKKGSICQENGIYRFVEMTYTNNVLDDVNRMFKDSPIVAVGIVSYWLMFKKNLLPIAKLFTEYNENPQDIKELFDNYTKVRFEQFKKQHFDNPETWNWDWEYEFYTKYAIPHELEWNKTSEALFDYISDSDIILVKSVMNNYIEYLKSHQAQYMHKTPTIPTTANKKTKKSNKKSKEIIINPKPKTFKYFKHGNNGILRKQEERVGLVFKKWNEWEWINSKTTTDDFGSLFEGEDKHCNIEWNANSTILSILLRELLKQSYIDKQKGQSASSMVKEQFTRTPNFDKKRITKEDKYRIAITVYILDIENPFPQKQGGGDNDFDTTDTAFQEVLSGQLRVTKGI